MWIWVLLLFNQYMVVTDLLFIVMAQFVINLDGSLNKRLKVGLPEAVTWHVQLQYVTCDLCQECINYKSYN